MVKPETAPSADHARRVHECERTLLGGMMHAESDHDELWASLLPTDFATDANQTVAYALRDLWAARTPISLTTVCDNLAKSGRMANLGADSGEAWEYVAGLYADAGTSSANAYHASEILDASRLRQLNRIAIEIHRDCISPIGPAIETIDAAAAKIFAISERRSKASRLKTSAEATNEALAEIDRRQRGETVPGIMSGLRDLDQMTGGLRKGELSILAARPSVGKTAMAHQLAKHASANDRPTLFVSLEQPTMELSMRALAAGAKVCSQTLSTGVALTQAEANRMADAADGLRVLKFHYDDTPSQTSLQILSTARQVKKSTGLDFVIVDYLQLIAPDDTRVSRNDQIDVITRRLREMARELDVAVLCLSQLSRECEKQGRRPRLSDLRDSGAIEQHAGTVFMLHRPERSPTDVDPIELGIEKQRNGPTGFINLAYRRAVLTFENAMLGGF